MILFNDFKRQWADTRLDAIEALETVGASGWYILGEEVKAFEASLAAFWGIREGVGVGSGLDAIEISLRALGCGAGDRVLTSPISAFATTLAILKLGARPAFVDCDEFGLIDLERCRAALQTHGGIRYFVPVHLFGHSLDMGALHNLKTEFGLSIIEDCAQSIGASCQGRATGTVGQMAATSFYPTKNLGAIGDGGAILVPDDGMAHKAKVLRDYGQTQKYCHAALGYNSRLDELQAAFLRRVFLPRLPTWVSRRRAIAEAYMAGIRNPCIHVPGQPAHSNSSWHLFPVLVEPGRKREFMAYLHGRGIMSAEHYPVSVFDQPVMREVEHELVGDCAHARAFCSREVSLPIHPYLADAEVSEIIETCNSWSGLN